MPENSELFTFILFFCKLASFLKCVSLRELTKMKQKHNQVCPISIVMHSASIMLSSPLEGSESSLSREAHTQK